MKKLLLVSSSKVHGGRFFEHCRAAVEEHLESVERLLFIPYALSDREQYARTVADVFAPLGVMIESIHVSGDPISAVNSAEAIFIGGGNSFRLLKTLAELGLLEPIRNAVLDRGVPYVGSSAGTNMACPTIRTTNDMPIVEPASFLALGLIPFQINPHFVDADPDSTHQGETREKRLEEFLEENRTPVAGIREGSWLKIEGDSCVLGGTTGMKLFRGNAAPLEVPAGDVSDLLGT